MIEQLFDFLSQIPSQDTELQRGNITSLLLKIAKVRKLCVQKLKGEVGGEKKIQNSYSIC